MKVTTVPIMPCFGTGGGGGGGGGGGEGGVACGIPI